MSNKHLDWHQLRRLAIFLSLAVVVVLLFFLLYYAFAFPLFLSMLATYLLAPLVHWLERLRLSRVAAIGVIIVLLFGAMGVGLYIVLPVLYREIAGLVQLTPQALLAIEQAWIPYLTDLIGRFGESERAAIGRAFADFNFVTQLSDRLGDAVSRLWYTTPHVVGRMVDIALVPFLTFFLLRDYQKIGRSLEKLVPRDLVSDVKHALHRVDGTLKLVIKGQVTVAAILAVLYSIGLSLTGLEASLAIGLVAGACRVVPYLDVIVGAGLSILVILSKFAGWGQVFGVFLVFLIVQSADGIFITPRVIGDKVGLHPGLVIASVISFGYWFGFYGVLLAIPICAVAKVFIESLVHIYFKSPAYDPGANA